MKATADQVIISKSGPLIFIAVLVIVTRVPWMFAGPGLDADTYRVLQVAKIIQETGIYEASRVPGYPLYEYLLALVYSSENYLVTNGFSAVSTAASAVYLALILRRLNIAMAELIALSFSFVPVVFNNSVVTMDYMPALSLVLAATYYVSINRIVTGGILLGLAAGFRFSSIFMVIPLCALILDTTNVVASSKRATTFCASCVGVMALCFLPVFARYGLGFLTFHDIKIYPTFERMITLGFSRVWGSFSVLAWALLAITWLFIVFFRRIPALPKNGTALLSASILVIGIYGVAFIRLPFESAYLIPIVPFVFVMICLLLPPPMPLVVVAIFAASSFVDRQGLSFRFKGPVQLEYQARISANERVNRTIAALSSIPDNAVIIAGWKLPQIQHELRLAGKDGSPDWIYLIRDEKEVHRFQAEGRPLYFLEKIDKYEMAVEGINLTNLGALPFPGDFY